MLTSWKDQIISWPGVKVDDLEAIRPDSRSPATTAKALFENDEALVAARHLCVLVGTGCLALRVASFDESRLRPSSRTSSLFVSLFLFLMGGGLEALLSLGAGWEAALAQKPLSGPDLPATLVTLFFIVVVAGFSDSDSPQKPIHEICPDEASDQDDCRRSITITAEPLRHSWLLKEDQKGATSQYALKPCNLTEVKGESGGPMDTTVEEVGTKEGSLQHGYVDSAHSSLTEAKDDTLAMKPPNPCNDEAMPVNKSPLGFSKATVTTTFFTSVALVMSFYSTYTLYSLLRWTMVATVAPSSGPPATDLDLVSFDNESQWPPDL